MSNTATPLQEAVDDFRQESAGAENPSLTFRDILQGRGASNRDSWSLLRDTINAIPNNPYGLSNVSKSHVSYKSMLSLKDETTKVYPASLRNKILYFMRQDEMGQVFSAVDTYLKIHEEHEEGGEDAILPSGEYSPPLKRQKANKRTVPCPPAPQRPRLTHADVLTNLQAFVVSGAVENDSSPTNAYNAYKLAQIEKGRVIARTTSEQCSVYILNDINMNTGQMLDNEFVHITVSHIEDLIEFNCPCAQQRLLTQLATINIEYDHDPDVRAVRCCHTKFLNEIICGHLKVSPEAGLRNRAVTLVSKNKKGMKFSVIGTDLSQLNFVHANDKTVSCQSGHCTTMKGSKRQAHTVFDAGTGMCPHLENLRANRETWWPEYMEHFHEYECSEEEEEDDDEEEEGRIHVVDGEEEQKERSAPKTDRPTPNVNLDQVSHPQAKWSLSFLIGCFLLPRYPARFNS